MKSQQKFKSNPDLLFDLIRMKDQGQRIDAAIDRIRSAGIRDEAITMLLLEKSGFDKDPLFEIVEAVSNE